MSRRAKVFSKYHAKALRAHEVRGLLDFEAIVIRRVLCGWVHPQAVPVGMRGKASLWMRPPREDIALGPFCPFGGGLDRWWVQEGWYVHSRHDWSKPRHIPEGEHVWYLADPRSLRAYCTKPRLSVHMPRWASRLVVEVLHAEVAKADKSYPADSVRAGEYFWKIGLRRLEL